jgi:hypothetical protein
MGSGSKTVVPSGIFIAAVREFFVRQKMPGKGNIHSGGSILPHSMKMW